MPDYKAFISYSHALDGKLAPALQRELRLLGRPVFKKEAFKIFRDGTDLSINPDLWSSIRTGLDSSEFLIYLASSEAAKSKWVKKEINYWLNNNTLETLIIVVTEGELVWDDIKKDFDWSQTNCLPEVLKGKYDTEPLYVDLKHLRSVQDLNIDNVIFFNAIKPISAKLHNRTIDELFGVVTRQHRRRLRIRNISTIVLIGLLVISLILGFISKQTAKANELAVLANQLVNTDPTKALQYYKKALQIRDNSNIRFSANKAYANNILCTDSIGPFKTHGVSVDDLIISPKNKWLAVIYSDSTLELWNMSNKSLCAPKIILTGPVKRISFSNKENVLSISHEIKEDWSIQKDSLIYLGEACETDEISTSLISDKEKSAFQLLIEDEYERSVEVRDSTGQFIATLGKHESYIFDATISPNLNLVLTTSRDKTAKLWTLDGENIYSLLGHQEDVNLGRFFNDGNKVLTYSEYEPFARIWQLKGYPIKNIPLTVEEQIWVATEEDFDVDVVGFLPGDTLLYVAKDGRDSLGQVTTCLVVQQLNGIVVTQINGIEVDAHADRGVSYMPIHKSFLAIKKDSAHLWDMNGNIIQSYEQPVPFFAISSPDESQILTFGADDFRIYNIEGSLLTVVSLTSGKYANLLLEGPTTRFSPDGSCFYIGANEMITKWNLEGELIDSIPISDQVFSLDISPNNNLLLVGGAKGIMIVNLENGNQLIPGTHSTFTRSVKFSPSGHQFLSGGIDGSVRLWDISGQLLLEFSDFPLLLSVSFSNNGQYIVSGGRNGVSLWQGMMTLEEYLMLGLKEVNINQLDKR